LPGNITKKDLELLLHVAEYEPLTVKQLAAVSTRSPQVIRRRIRLFEKEELSFRRIRGYGRGPGRPEDLVLLSEKGAKLLQNKGMIHDNPSHIGDKTIETHAADHDLLINWFRIHLLQIQKVIPQIAINYTSPKYHESIMERIPKEGSPKYIDFFPDGVFSIRNDEKGKSLLFFLEVDLGTETIASRERGPKDIRQKILNYQTLFLHHHYRHYERFFDSRFKGFRLLFLANTISRLSGLCRLVQEMPPSGFVWLTDQEKMFSLGLSAEIWARGGRNDKPLQSILGPSLACESSIGVTTE